METQALQAVTRKRSVQRFGKSMKGVHRACAREIKKGNEEENHENFNIQTNTRFKGSEDWPSLCTCYLSEQKETAIDIRKALYTLLDHLVEKHESCPFSKSSWCYFQKTLALSVEDSSITPPKLRLSYLNGDELSRLQDVFLKFASLDMCSALTLGLTQNANESLHSVLWHNAPKGKRVGQYSLQASASQ